MAGSLADYAEKMLLDFLTNATSVTRPTTLYLGLFTSATDEVNGGTEVSGNNYARQTISFSPATLGAGTTQNTNTLNFTATGGDWGQIGYVRIYDAITGGNPLLYGPMTTAITIHNGDTLSFNPGVITAALD